MFALGERLCGAALRAASRRTFLAAAASAAAAPLPPRGGWAAAAASVARFSSGANGEEGVFVVPQFALQCGGVLPEAQLVYKTYGAPGRPCVLHPTSFDATHPDLEYAIGPGRILDTDKYFVVVPARRPAAAATLLRAAATGRRSQA